MIAPCANCTERYVNCHSECDKYKTWKQDLENEKKLVRQKKTPGIELDVYKQSILRNERRSKRT